MPAKPPEPANWRESRRRSFPQGVGSRRDGRRRPSRKGVSRKKPALRAHRLFHLLNLAGEGARATPASILKEKSKL
jgi:hypothetical protein